MPFTLVHAGKYRTGRQIKNTDYKIQT